MMFPTKLEYLAVVPFSLLFLELWISQRNCLTKAIHGIKNIKILQIMFDLPNAMMYFLISSPDIPEWVAHKRIMEEPIELFSEEMPVPKVGLTFEDCFCKNQAIPRSGLDQASLKDNSNPHQNLYPFLPGYEDPEDFDEGDENPKFYEGNSGS